MKVLVPVSTVLRIAFWLVALAVVAGFAAGQRDSAAPVPESPATTQVVHAVPGEEVAQTCRRI